MGKRKTAKTGDKALYNSREQLANKFGNKKKSNDDPMYDEVDRFHNDRDQDFIRLDEESKNSDDVDEDLAGNTHSVLDLGAGGTSSEEEDDDDSSSDEEDRYVDKQAEDYSSSDDSDSSDDEEEMNLLQEDPRNWGKKKSLYYHGDTADLEIGQEEDDAFLEEEAAQEIQKSRFEEMDEGDFMLSEDEQESSSKMGDNRDGGASDSKYEKFQTIRDTSKLSKKETRKLLDKQFPELLPMTSYFSDIVKDLRDRTDVATNALMESTETAESVGATMKGQQYLVTKAMIQKSIALNSIMYILLRYASVGEEDATSNIQSHPVMDHLKKLTTLLENLEESVKTKSKNIDEQLDNLVKAAALMTNEGLDDDSGSVDEDTKEKSSSSIEALSEQNGKDDSDVDIDAVSDDSNDESDEDTRDAIAEKQRNFDTTLYEARFGLRPDELRDPSTISLKRRNRHLDDFGDLKEDENNRVSQDVLASTINTIEQRSKTASRKRRAAPVAEELDDLDDYDDRVAQGLKMMEEEMGKLDDDGDADEAMDMGGDIMSDPDTGDDFYDQIIKESKRKKAIKKSLYKVAPKFPRIDGEVAGERSISRAILKNRGLVAHKAKINRNPRVKKREQYRKALIRRKGAVREVRDASEGNTYGGEQTGIKTRISRSRKL